MKKKLSIKECFKRIFNFAIKILPLISTICEIIECIKDSIMK